MTDKKTKTPKEPWLEGEILFINGIRVRKAFLLGLGLPIGLSLIVAFSVVGFLLWEDRQEAAANEVEILEKESNQGETIDVPPDLSRTVQVLERHRKATGLGESESLVFEGTYTTRGLDFELTIFAKRPGLFRQKLQRQDLAIISGWNGRRYWEHNPASQLGDRAVVRHAINVAMLKMQASPASVVWQYLENGSGLFQWVERRKVDEQLCDVLANNALLAAPVHHYIDANSGRELRREATVTIGSESMQIIIEFQHASRDVSAETARHGLPAGYHLFLNDLMVAEARFESLRVNTGVMPWMFERLEE